MSPPTNQNNPSATNNDTEPRVINRSCESMRELDDGSVTLTVTSPPYGNAMSYTDYEQGAKHHKKREYAAGCSDYTEYLAQMQRVAAELFRVTRPGGFVAVNSQVIQDNGRCVPVTYDLVRRFLDLGFELHFTIVWNKTCTVLNRGHVIQFPFPGYYKPNIKHELVHVFRRPGPKLFHQVERALQEASRIPLSKLLTREITDDVWHIPPVPATQRDHPCPFPAELAHRLIVLLSHKGDLVLDPFLGSGTTGQAAVATGRRFVGYEIEPRFAQLAEQRIREPLKLRPRQHIGRTEVIEDDPFLRLGMDSAEE